MKTNILFGFAIMLYLGSKSQTVTPTIIGNDGGFSTAAGGSIAWTIGEPISETYTATTNITTMGFHQPDASLITMIKEQGTGAFLVYPNPVQEFVRIDFSGVENGKYDLQLHDALGKLLFSSNAEISENSKLVSLKMNEYSAGAYFLEIKGKNLEKTVKINKIN